MERPDPRYAALPYAREVVDFQPGDSSGFGQESFPEIVLGPPRGRGPDAGSLDVLSLGVGGVIVLSFGDRAIEDRPGPDFVVFENPFYMGGNPAMPFAERAQVSVSEDGEVWQTFECPVEPVVPGRWPGCAGWNPVLEFDPLVVDPLDPEQSGGDPFDLADVGVGSARYVRIEDLSTEGLPITAGFDLDAVGIVHPIAADGP